MMLNFLRNDQIVSHSNWTILNPPLAMYWDFSVFINNCYFYTNICHFLLKMYIAIVVGINWYLRVVLICIPLMPNEVSISSCIYWSSLETCLFKSFTCFEIELSFDVLSPCTQSQKLPQINFHPFIIRLLPWKKKKSFDLNSH